MYVCIYVCMYVCMYVSFIIYCLGCTVSMIPLVHPLTSKYTFQVMLFLREHNNKAGFSELIFSNIEGSFLTYSRTNKTNVLLTEHF